MRKIKTVFKKMRVYSLLLALMCITLFISCSEDDDLGVPKQDNISPGVPILKTVTNLNGGAIIFFDAPKDKDLMCIVASYVINGKKYETKASPYLNFLNIEGFGSEGEYKVYLESVDFSQNKSEKVEVTINPKEAPVDLIYKSLNVLSGFGGVELSWKNIAKANVIVSVSALDSLGDWKELEEFYSASEDGRATVRGMDTLEVTIGVTIRDRWDNYSEMQESKQLPLFEIEADKDKFEALSLPGDASPWTESYGQVENLWNEDYTSEGEMFHTNEGGIGKYITFNMGQLMKLSRFKTWHRLAYNEWIYAHNNMKHYAVYGCEEITEEMFTSGSIEGWTLLKDTWTYKPSGDGPVEPEDIEYIRGGDEHSLSLELPAVQYIRIHLIEAYNKGTLAQIQEMTFWGQLQIK